MADVDNKGCSCLATTGEHYDDLSKRETNFPNRIHYIKFGSHQMLAVERCYGLYIPIDTVKQTIGSAAYQALIDYKSLNNVELLTLESTDVKMLEEKYRSHGNISYKDLIKLDDLLSFCKKFTSTDLSNSVITELALNSSGRYNFCHHCGQWKGSTGNLMSGLDWIPPDSCDILDLNLVKTKCSVGYIDIGSTKMKAFKLQDDLFICFKDIVKNKIMTLPDIQRGLKELNIKPIAAPHEIYEHMCKDEVQSYKSLWFTVETCLKVFKLLKKRVRKKTSTDLFITNLKEGIYSFHSNAELHNVSLEQTPTPLAVDSITLELIQVEHETFNCIHQKSEQFYIIYRTRKDNILKVHEKCNGCCFKMKQKSLLNRQKHVDDKLLTPSNESNCQNDQVKTKYTTNQEGIKTEDEQSNDDCNNSNKHIDSNKLFDDLCSALALEPGDYIVSDYPKFCELLNTATDSNTSSDGMSIDIDSEDQYATKIIEEEMQFESGCLDTLVETADLNNNILGEAMEMCGIVQNCNETFLQKSESNVESELSVLDVDGNQRLDSINCSEDVVPVSQSSVCDKMVASDSTETYEVSVDSETSKRGQSSAHPYSVKTTERGDSLLPNMTKPYKLGVHYNKAMPVLTKEKLKGRQGRKKKSDGINMSSKQKVDKCNETGWKKYNRQRYADSACDVMDISASKPKNKLKRKMNRNNTYSYSHLGKTQNKRESRNSDARCDTDVESVKSMDGFEIEIYKTKGGTKIMVKNWEKYEESICKCAIMTGDIKKVKLTNDKRVNFKEDGSQMFESENTGTYKKHKNVLRMDVSKVLKDKCDIETMNYDDKDVSVNSNVKKLISHNNIQYSKDCYVKILRMPWLDKLV
ncbi:hypothetical protein ACF0H5_003665 [Mactra antiquata]